MSDFDPQRIGENDIAVVGMALRFPDATTLDEYWRNLIEGRESVRFFDESSLRERGVSAARLAHPDYVKAGVVLDDVEKWDAGFFGFNPKDASIMDPQHRVFLEVAWEALESAGYPPERTDGPVGVFAGCGMNAYFMFHVLTHPKLVQDVGLFLLRHTGNDKDFLSTRVSYEFDLKGPSVNVQTACSTSLVAIHMACQSLLNGECDLALSGGVTVELPMGHGYVYEQGEILSRDGHCRAFDASSTGTVFGSGGGAVILKRAREAWEAGDTIHALVKGTAINNDGAGKVGYLAPSVDGQAAAIAEALAVADAPPRSVTYVESHGTGTALGDPIEIAALTQAFRTGTEENGFCGIGSVKSNIGHLDTAAGVASFIKAALALKHKKMPPSLGFETPNPECRFDASPFFVVSEARDWDTDRLPRRAGISSLGVGGTNAHVILEEAPPRPASSPSRDWLLLPLSARTDFALDQATANLVDWLGDHPEVPLADVAWTLEVGRRAMPRRRVAVVRDAADAAQILESRDPERVFDAAAGDVEPDVAFMFPGGGAQYPNVARDLYGKESAFTSALDACFERLKGVLETPLETLLFPTPENEEDAGRRLEEPKYSILAVYSISYALAEQWRAWGVVPAAMTGHSLGEYVAATVAGVMSLDDALKIVVKRGEIFERMPRGGMLSVPVDEETLLPYLDDRTSIAVINAPGLCVASGAVDALESLAQRLEAAGLDSRRIPISVAAHSPLLDPFLEEFRATLETLTLAPPKIPFVSNRSGAWITDDEATDPAYWVEHLRRSVRFADGLGMLLERERRVLLEVGPGKTLGSLAKQHPSKGAGHVVLSSVRHADERADDRAFLSGVFGRLWCSGVDVDWAAFHDGETRHRVPLPTYPFERQPYWIEPGRAVHAGGADAESRREDVGNWFAQPHWVPSAPETPDLEDDGVVAVLGADDPRGEAVAAAFEARGRKVWRVVTGPSFSEGDGTAVLPDSSDADFDRLLTNWHREGFPRVVIDLRPAAAGASDNDVERPFRIAFAAARALSRDEPDAPLRWLCVTAGAEQVGGEPVPHPAQAAASAAMRVAALEVAPLEVRAVDLDPGAAPESVVRALVAEASAPADDRPAAWRGRQRFERRFAARTLPAGRPDLPDGTLVAITGGLGGIALAVARALANDGPCAFLLVSRRGLPERERWDAFVEAGDDPRAVRQIRAVRDIESTGSTVRIAALDATDADALRAAIEAAEAEHGPLRFVVHAAGVLDDALLPEKTPESAHHVLAPKIAGLHALEEAVGDRPLERFHVFSSTSALACPVGQVDYAAANAYCDAWARRRAAEGKPATAIAWGAWRDVGMAAEIASGERDPGAEVMPFRHPARHPWLDTVSQDESGARRFRTTFATSSHWLVDEHRVKDGTPLIPGAGYLELLRAAWHEATPEVACEIADVDFLSPFVVPDDTPRTLEIELQPTAEGAFEVSVTSRVPTPDGATRDEEHVAGRVRPLGGDAPEIDLGRLRERIAGPTETFERAPGQAHLAFGPRWDNLRTRTLGDGEALLELTLPSSFVDDLGVHPLHPALLDIGTAAAQPLIPGYDDERTFYVPIGVGRLRAWAPLESDLRSHVRYRPEDDAGGEFAVFDVTFFGPDGRVLVEVERFTMKRIEGEATLSADPAGTAATARGSSELAELLEEAIRPAEGADAWLRIAAHAEGPHWIATPHEIDATLDALRRTASPSAATQELPEVDVSAARAALASHPAVAEVEILPRMPRPGQLRLVAYVVRDDDHDATVSELRRHVKAAVPKDQVPAAFEDVDEIPRDDDGNPRADALPDPFADDESFVAPRTPAEKIVGEIWKEILGVEAVSVYDNFFDIGGHSLLSMRVVNKVDKKTGVRLNQAVMVLQTLEQISAEVEKQGGAPSADAAPTEAREDATASGTPRDETKTPAAETTEDDAGLFRRLRRSVFKG